MHCCNLMGFGQRGQAAKSSRWLDISNTGIRISQSWQIQGILSFYGGKQDVGMVLCSAKEA